jgi:ribonuclease R
LGGGKTPTPLDYAKLLRSAQKRPDVNIIQSVLLRSLSQAVYSKDNLGHFGLAYPAYSHFTSPIRRYPDLLVHRQIRSVLREQWNEKKRVEASQDDYQEALAALGDHTSMTERRADDATRDVLRWLKCEYMKKHLGESFQGIVSGVTRFGFFVELKDIYIDGLVHVTSLRNDYYFFDAIHHRLIGERSGISFKLGDGVKVRVIKVDVDDRKIDFELLEIDNASSPSKKTSIKYNPEGEGRRGQERRGRSNQEKESKGKGAREKTKARRKRPGSKTAGKADKTILDVTQKSTEPPKKKKRKRIRHKKKPVNKA